MSILFRHRAVRVVILPLALVLASLLIAGPATVREAPLLQSDVSLQTLVAGSHGADEIVETIPHTVGTIPHAPAAPALVEGPSVDVHGALAQARYDDQLRQQKLDELHQDLSLHAVGSQVYTAWKTPMTIKALNWYGLEYRPFVAGGLDKLPLDSIMAMVRRLRFNALRIMFANEMVESNPVVTTGLNANPALRGLHSLDILDRILQEAQRYNIRVILCDSRSEAGMGPELLTGLWYTAKYPASAWEKDWIDLATRFRYRRALVGMDLRNEPHMTGAAFNTPQLYFANGPLWGAYQGTYYHDHDWRYAAETMGNRLLAVNPHLMIIVEGVQIYLDPDRKVLTGGLWGSNLIGVQYDPINLRIPGQLMYSVHEYGPKMWLGGWFLSNQNYQQLADRWTTLWGYLLSASKIMQAPVFVGEFGTCNNYHSCIQDPNKPYSQGFWFTSFVRYLRQHPQVGWAYWALNPTGPFHPTDLNFYSLLTPDWRHVHPLITQGLAPLLTEPNG